MIIATFYFINGIDIDSFVYNLQELSEPITPIYFGENEGKIIKTNMISDQNRFSDFRKHNQAGFFLFSENKTLFDISIHSIEYVEITIYFVDELSSELVDEVLKNYIQYKPIFGFVCDENEYDHRNRYYVSLGENHIESWIGRDLNKYISGVYWYTILSDELLNKNHVDLARLSAEAISSETLTDNAIHLLKFYKSANDWKQNAERLDNLCEHTRGMFSKRHVESVISGVSNYLEYDEIIDEWR